MGKSNLSCSRSWVRAPNADNGNYGYEGEAHDAHLLCVSLSRMSKKYHEASGFYKLSGKVGFYKASIIQKDVIHTFMEQINNNQKNTNNRVTCKSVWLSKTIKLPIARFVIRKTHQKWNNISYLQNVFFPSICLIGLN